MSRPIGNAKIVKSLPQTGRFFAPEQYQSMNPRLNPNARSFNPQATGRMFKNVYEHQNENRWK